MDNEETTDRDGRSGQMPRVSPFSADSDINVVRAIDWEPRYRVQVKAYDARGRALTSLTRHIITSLDEMRLPREEFRNLLRDRLQVIGDDLFTAWKEMNKDE